MVEAVRKAIEAVWRIEVRPGSHANRAIPAMEAHLGDDRSTFGSADQKPALAGGKHKECTVRPGGPPGEHHLSLSFQVLLKGRVLNSAQGSA